MFFRHKILVKLLNKKIKYKLKIIYLSIKSKNLEHV